MKEEPKTDRVFLIFYALCRQDDFLREKEDIFVILLTNPIARDTINKSLYNKAK